MTASDWSRRLWNPAVLSVGIVLAVFAGVQLWADQGRLLQRWELSTYDMLLRARHDPTARDPRITIVGINESDIQAHDYPLLDGALARLLEKLLAAQPRAIGLDLYRDLPEPRTGEDLPTLNRILETADNLVAVFALSDAQGGGVPPPPSVKDVERLAFNDFPSDDATIRRALFLGGGVGEEWRPSLALNLALRFLTAETADRLEFASPDPFTLRIGKARFRRFQQNDGGYSGSSDAGFQVPLDFRGPGTFTTYSLDEVLNGQVPADAFRDRIILVGVVARSVKDTLGTPLDPFCPGVLLHAQVINQILRAALEGEQPTTVWPEWLEAIWTLGWTGLGAVTGWLLLRSRKRSALVAVFSLAAALAGFALLGAITWLAFHNGIWLPSVRPAIGFTLATFASVASMFYWERRQRSELMQLFSRHVSGKVAEDIWRQRDTFLDGSRPRSRLLTATVLFSDLVGFSSVSEKMTPGELMDWLNEGMETMARRVEEHDGIVNKYIGDSVMAIFGVPVPRTSPSEIAQDATNAVRCALAMSDDLQTLNARWATEGRHAIGMRIGIYTGLLVAGSLGSANRLEFTVIGDAVNTASRLESTKKDEILPPSGRACRILIGDSTYALLDSQFQAEYVGDETLKGKENKVSVYRIVAEKGAVLAAPLESAHL